MDADDLTAVEEIKQLKARYFRLMDTKRWDEFADVFTSDLTSWVEDVPDVTRTSRDDFVKAVIAALTDSVTVHHGHMPEIEITGPDTARGIWSMFDYVKMVSPRRTVEFKGYGHYHEEYRREADGRWRISSLRLYRLRIDNL